MRDGLPKIEDQANTMTGFFQSWCLCRQMGASGSISRTSADLGKRLFPTQGQRALGALIEVLVAALPDWKHSLDSHCNSKLSADAGNLRPCKPQSATAA